MVLFNFLIPLYVYPGGNGWSSIYTTVAQYPLLNFSIVINPNNGPGSNPPNSDYITGIAELNSYANVNTLGYVSVDWAARSPASVNADVAIYNGWGNYTEQNIALDGIFFDGTPTGTDSYSISYMQTAAAYVKTMSNLGHTIWFNAGATTPAPYYALANYVGAYEQPNTYYTNGTNQATNTVPLSLRPQSAALVYSYSASNAQLLTDTVALLDAGYFSIWISDRATFASIPTIMSTFVRDVCSTLGLCGTTISSSVTTRSSTTSSSSSASTSTTSSTSSSIHSTMSTSSSSSSISSTSSTRTTTSTSSSTSSSSTAVGTNNVALGCYVDTSSRVLPYSPSYNQDSMTPSYCAGICATAGYAISGTEYSYQCFCGSTIPSTVATSGCNYTCSGDSSQICGGSYRLSVVQRH